MPETEMLIQTNQHRSLCNSRKRHIPEAVEQQRTVREVQEQPEALRTDRERVVTVVLREVQGQREVQPEQVREVVHQPEQEAEQQEVQERQEMVHQREILQPGQAENQLAAKVPRSRTTIKIEKGVLFMKKVEKIIVSFLLMCMLCVGMTCVASATAAEFRFSDPQTSVGAEVEVTAKVSSAKALNTIQATLSYDKTKLRFISGDDATGGDGTITISRNDENAGTTMEFNLKFQALDEGTTSVEVAKVDGIDSNGVALEITSGSSSVSIAEGDKSLIQEEDTSSAVDGTEVKIGKSKYIVTDDFSDTIIPDGFVRDALKFEGTDHQIIKQESSGALAMYLTPENGGDADFYLYDSDTGNFSPLEVIEVAKGRYIIPLG